jgi:hypothetical protein
MRNFLLLCFFILCCAPFSVRTQQASNPENVIAANRLQCSV